MEILSYSSDLLLTYDYVRKIVLKLTLQTLEQVAKH